MADCLRFDRPESVGVHPDWVRNYVEEVERRELMCHSFLMMRHGTVIAEGYWKPFTPDRFHRMYSVSKTFVSAAIGALCDEGKITLDDRIATYFPDQLPENPDPYLMETTIRDMLMMASPHYCQSYRFDDMDWLHTFFNPHYPPDHPAGTLFRYDTSATYVLDVLVERLTGKSFLEYLKDRFLRDLGFSEDSWCVCAPEGHAWGGSGVECTTRDLARFALIFLNGGKVGKKQCLSEDYVRAATSYQIDNCVSGHRDCLHGHGYGYQIWITRDGSFSFLGMGGQMAVCIPKYDFLFVCTSDTQGRATGYTEIFEAMWHHVVEKLSPTPLPADEEAYNQLQQKLNRLSCVLPVGALSSPNMAQYNGITYQLQDNPMQIQRFRLEFQADGGTFYYQTPQGEKELPFGFGHYAEGLFPEIHYSGSAINHPLGRGYRCMTAAVWTEPRKLVLRNYIVDDYLGNLNITFSFKNDQVAVVMQKTAEAFLDLYQGTASGNRID